MSNVEPDSFLYSRTSEKTLRSFTELDDMPGDLRECVYEFGYPIVKTCLTLGIKSPGQIRQLAHEFWTGPRNHRQRVSGSKSIIATLDWILQKVGAEINAMTLLRVIHDGGFVLLPQSATQEMTNASMEAVNRDMGLMSKPDKHRRRLNAAVRAGGKALWPHLYRGQL